MNLHPFIGFANTDNAIAGDRVTAFRQLVSDPGSQAPDGQRLTAAQPFGIVIGQTFGAARHERLHDFAIGDLCRSDGIIEVVLIFHLKPSDRSAEGLLADLGRDP